METIQAAIWRQEFERRAAISEEQRQRLAFELVQRKLREEKKERKERDEREFTYFQMMVLATETQIADFTLKLDTYDAATVEALMQNEADLKVVHEKIDRMLLEAHQLPSGERVFKTRDGTRVFNESGQEVSPEIIKPEQISDNKPYWEEFKGLTDRRAELETERADLHEYQNKLDKARDRLDDPNLSKDELDALDKELGDAMPQRVRANLGLNDRDITVAQQNEATGQRLDKPHHARNDPRSPTSAL